MARLQNTIHWRDISGANVQKVSSDITIQNAVPFSINLLFDEVFGEAISREGTGLVGAPGSGNCLGLFQHIDSTFASSKLFAGFGTSIYNAVTLSEDVTGLTVSAKQRYCTFLNTTLMLNGSQKRAYTAAGGWVSGGTALDIGNIPAGAQYPVEFKDRVYAAITDQLYYTTTPTAGVVSWAGAGSGSLQVEQEDGGGTIKGLNKVPGYLIIYKDRSLKRWNFDSSFPEDLVNIGTQSNESIIRARGKNFFFYGPNGFYETNGGYPSLISRPIQRIIDGISSANYANVNGWSDNKDIYWSVGDVTVDFDRGYTETYSNVVLRYTIDTQQWAPLRYYHAFKFMTQYLNGNDVLIVGGDAAGQVLQLNTGNTDYNGQAITYILQSPEFTFGLREKRKTIAEKIYVHSDGSNGAMLQARLDYGEWKEIGTIKDIVTEVQIKPMTARVFEFRITDSITGEQIKLRGLDFPTIDVLEN